MKTNDTKSQDRGFTLLVATLALLISMGAMLAVAFKLNGNQTSQASASPQTSHKASSSSAVETVKLTVKSDEEHAKKGPEGTWHDAYLPAGFTVQPGATVKVVVSNYDEGAHSFTSTALGTNVIIAAGKPNKPTVTTFTFHAPAKAGRYQWWCNQPCDPWSMSHNGYMRGFVTVA